jgi:outer membrane protein TolC
MRIITLLVCTGILAPAWSADPSQLAERGVLQLSLKRAVEIGLSPEGSAAIQLARENVRQADARSMTARAELLPDLKGTFGVQSLTRNLSAMGLEFEEHTAALGIPRSVGPFRVMDARVSMEQRFLDMSALRRFQASKAGIRVAQAAQADTRDQAAARIAQLYLAALRARATVEAVQENVRLAEVILKQADSLNNAGIGTGIEVTRARVVLANEMQRRLVAENDQSRARQELLRAMGVPPGTRVELTDSLSFVPPETASLEEWKSIAYKNRDDLQAQQAREEEARLQSSATKLERAPVVKSFADYGSIGSGADYSIPTRTVGISVELPLLDGGRRKSRILESQSKQRQERVRTHDLQDQIALEVQLALDAVRSAEQEFSVAKEGLSLAERELEQARHRYLNGVATSTEVADAQTRLSQARDNRVAALYRHNHARVQLAAATGTIENCIQ